MGKKGKKNSNKTPKVSGGTKHQARARRHITRLKMKINRWQRYNAEGVTSKLSKNHICHVDKKATCYSRHHKWNTEGLLKQLKMWEKVLKKPALRR